MAGVRPSFFPKNIFLRDLESAAILIGFGFEPSSTAWRDGKLFFEFPDVPETRNILALYRSGRMRLEPSNVFACYRKAHRLPGEPI